MRTAGFGNTWTQVKADHAREGAFSMIRRFQITIFFFNDRRVRFRETGI
jgi:hypothetical protein